MESSIGRRLREAGLLLALALAGYLVLALASFSPQDPGWSYLGAREQAHNAAGPIGAWLADVLLTLFGLWSYLLPLMIAWAGWLPLRERRPEPLEVIPGPHVAFVRWAGLLMTLTTGSALASVHVDATLLNLPEGAGGILGRFVEAGFIDGALSQVGGSLLLIAGLMIGLSFFTGISWLTVVEGIGGLTLAGYGRVAAVVRGLPARRAAEHMRQAREENVRKVRRRGAERKAPTLATPVAEEGHADTDSTSPAAEAASVSAPLDKPLPPVRVEREPHQITLIDIEPNAELPPLSLLDPPRASGKAMSTEALQLLGQQVELKLADFGVTAEVVAISPGPVVTLFELNLAPGTKVSKVSNLSKDLARALSTIAVRVVEVIPGKSVIGLEIPNEHRETVFFSEVLRSEVYDRAKSPLTLVLGKDIAGAPVVADLARMPHALIAGTTGSGKSVAINAMVLSLLYKAKADEVRLIMIDPKMLELSVYEGIPHLLTPVVTDMSEAANALRWCVGEMERRYRLMAAIGVRNIAGLNKKIREARAAGEPLTDPLWMPEPSLDDSLPPPAPELETMPYIVVIIDELADMMMVVGKKVEELIARLAQKARAAGIHLLLATQRPSVDVITGLIKANIPTRVAFQVSSRIDSRTILDQSGAEQLLGHGDMLYLPPGSGIPQRTHGAFVSDEEVHRVVAHLKASGEANYLEEILREPTEAIPGLSPEAAGVDTEDADPLFDEAVQIVTETRRASISGVQRRLKIGYNRAARLVEEMERIGVVSMADSKGNREVLAPPPVSDG